MQKLLDNSGQIIENDPWMIVPKDFDGAVTKAHSLLPLQYWLDTPSNPDQELPTGIWFDSDEEPETVAARVNQWACIGIHFPTFMDGRGFTLARFIREHYGYEGELRAFGHIIPDQLFFLSRCGFDSFLLESPSDEMDPQLYFDNFSVIYQSCADQPQPLFRRRA
ncbi:MAG: DUF934 domain-containing protein [Porticoccaceae bacterium]|nr:DUF934 domain-containing protein [Porticoccaceae bacterium]